MAKYDVTLRPIHYASVSGGKDSLYMLNLILNNLDKYPLDMVVHYELEIDWDWVKDVIDFMEQRCKEAGLKFLRIKPRKTWEELFEKYDMPRKLSARWCNSHSQLDAKEQLNQWIKSQNCRPIAYIGLCADEVKRFKYNVGVDNWELQDICYPLAEEGINEDVILEWAKSVPIFKDWYKHFNRQGCMLCPMLTMKEKAYMYLYYPDKFEYYIEHIRHWESNYNSDYFDEPLERHVNRIKTKWVEILKTETETEQMTIFDYINDLGGE